MPAGSERGFAERLVFLHGFTQTHHHWHAGAHAVARHLGGHPTLAFVDLPGHGLSRRDETPIADSGGPLAAIGGTGTYVGYSMGGRFGLFAALARPDVVERLVLIGATAGIDDPDERLDRRHLDHERADRLEALGLDAFLDEWLAAPMFAGLPADEAGLRHRRRNDVAGLAHSLRTCGTGSQPTLWPRLGEIAAPVLVLAGSRDTKFTEIGRRLADALPAGAFDAVPNAGHAAHAEAPDATAEIIADWLRRS
jgi:2-succinyl-6-hydroxy-2,4-cyclohexadiene-1-carboxylate synthase